MLNELHVLIEMNDKPDCRFVGSWLLKAAEAQSSLAEALRDPAFKDAASALCSWCEPNLECAALEALSALRQQDPRFHPPYETPYVQAVDLDFCESGIFGVEFAILVQLGFFVLAGRTYHMTLPESVTLEQVQRAGLRVASTETDDGDIQPEILLHTLAQAEAEAWRCWVIQKHRFDRGELGEMRYIGGVRISLSDAVFRVLDRLPLGDKWARWGAIVVTGRSDSGPS